jgi:hypothetical protein
VLSRESLEKHIVNLGLKYDQEYAQADMFSKMCMRQYRPYYNIEEIEEVD